jgi:hypothetical protein
MGCDKIGGKRLDLTGGNCERKWNKLSNYQTRAKQSGGTRPVPVAAYAIQLRKDLAKSSAVSMSHTSSDADSDLEISEVEEGQDDALTDSYWQEEQGAEDHEGGNEEEGDDATDNEPETGGHEGEGGEEETVVEESVDYAEDGSMRMSPVSGTGEGEETEGALSPSLLTKHVSNSDLSSLASAAESPPLLKQRAAAAAVAAAVAAVVAAAVAAARPNASYPCPP